MWWASKEVLNAMSVCVKFALQKASTKGIPIWTQDFSAERSICAPPERSNRSIEDDAERRPGGLWKKRVSSQGWDCAHCSLVASLRKPPVTGHFPLNLEKLAQYYFFFFFSSWRQKNCLKAESFFWRYLSSMTVEISAFRDLFHLIWECYCWSSAPHAFAHW